MGQSLGLVNKNNVRKVNGIKSYLQAQIKFHIILPIYFI